jgi:HD-like signal output (HDOD) protein
MAAVAALIEQDPAVVLKLLQVVGSGYFCLPCATCNVAEAIAHLGLEPLRSVIMSVNVHNGLPPAASLDLAAFQAHAFAVARTARLVAGGPGEPGDEAFVAGLLHDVGRLALANAPPELKGSEVPCVLAGGEGAVDHAKVGAYVADLWGLPGAVVAALSEQRCVRDLDHQAVAASDAVYAAHLLLGSSELDEAERAYLARVGLLDRWASLAATASAYAGTS